MSPSSVTALAPAKVNLYLHVLGRRPDGYHELQSLAAFADAGDMVGAAAADDGLQLLDHAVQLIRLGGELLGSA